MSVRRRSGVPDIPKRYRTDKYEVVIWPENKKICFHRLQVLYGEIVARSSPTFTLSLQDFERHPAILSLIIDWVECWLPARVKLTPTREPKAKPKTKGDDREYLIQGKI